MAGNLLIGVDRPFIRDIKEEIGEKSNIGADYFVAPLFHPRLRRDCNGVSEARLGAVTRSDRELESRQWITYIVGKISEWIDLDNPDPSIQKASLQALQQETAWAAHLSLQAILVPSPRFNSANYARALMHCFTGYQQIYVRVPMVPPLSMHYETSDNVDTNEPSDYCKDGWLVWDGLRQNLGDFNRFFVALELTKDCEDLSIEANDAFVKRWCAEPVKLIILHTNLFTNNSAGYPVLSKRMQQILDILLSHCSQILLTGKAHREGGSYAHYAQYLRHLRTRNVAQMSEAEKYVLGYEDTLQAPLQPLMDNLEAQTYETFERDPMKYIKYEEAITKALVHLHGKRQLEHNAASAATTFGTEEESAKMNHSEPVELVLTVVGAGRGPLVAAALSASSTTGVPVRIYAVEKNANAVITLRNRVRTEFWSKVTVIATDMRDWQPPEQCDLMISELLGSFGDNELSPECLDGAQKCLKQDGISIPRDYTSFIAPIATTKLWTTAKNFNLNNSTIANGLDTAYVVRFKSCYQFAEAKPLFVFEHPNHPPNGAKIDNTRYKHLSFVSETDMVMHGIAGFFESTLFAPPATAVATSTGMSSAGATPAGSPRSFAAGSSGSAVSPPPPAAVSVPAPPAVPMPPGMGLAVPATASASVVAPLDTHTACSNGDSSADERVMLSIVPQTHTPGMFSWFPLFIPLSQPIRVLKGQTITIHIWRCTDARKVWYEWCLSSPVRTPIQNSNGKAYSVGL